MSNLQYIEARIITELQKSIDIDILKHTHKPVRYLVDNCQYCKKFGNCFNVRD